MASRKSSMPVTSHMRSDDKNDELAYVKRGGSSVTWIADDTVARKTVMMMMMMMTMMILIQQTNWRLGLLEDKSHRFAVLTWWVKRVTYALAACMIDDNAPVVDSITGASRRWQSNHSSVCCMCVYSSNTFCFVKVWTAKIYGTGHVEQRITMTTSTTLSVTHLPVSGISFPRNFSWLLIMKTYHSYLISHTSVRHFFHHHCHHPLLRLSSTPGSKLIFSTNPFPHSSSTFPPTERTPWTPAVFRFYRALCARLSWLLVSFEVHIKSSHIIIIIIIIHSATEIRYDTMQ